MRVLIDCTDPRSSLPVMPARLGDQLTQHTVVNLTDAVALTNLPALSARQIGVPVALLAVHHDDMIQIYLNPRVIGQEGLYLSEGEASPQCRGLRRDCYRFRKLTIEAMDVTGRQVIRRYDGDLARHVQEALELLGSQRPFAWLTASHALTLLPGAAPADAGAPALLRRLYDAPRQPGAGAELYFTGPDQLAFGAAGSEPAGRINALNPLLPCSPKDQLLLSLTVMMTAFGRIWLSGAEKFGLALALRLISPGLVLHVGEEGGWLARASAATGLSAHIRQHSSDIRETMPEALGPQSLDAVILDLSGEAPPRPPADRALQAIGQSLSGHSGALMLVADAEADDITAALMRRFHSLYLFAIPGGGVVYVARNGVIDAPQMWSRIAGLAQKHAQPELLAICAGGGFLLRKDGRREAI